MKTLLHKLEEAHAMSVRLVRDMNPASERASEMDDVEQGIRSVINKLKEAMKEETESQGRGEGSR